LSTSHITTASPFFTASKQLRKVTCSSAHSYSEDELEFDIADGCHTCTSENAARIDSLN
jgi:hypothetical protein